MTLEELEQLCNSRQEGTGLSHYEDNDELYVFTGAPHSSAEEALKDDEFFEAARQYMPLLIDIAKAAKQRIDTLTNGHDLDCCCSECCSDRLEKALAAVQNTPPF